MELVLAGGAAVSFAGANMVARLGSFRVPLAAGMLMSLTVNALILVSVSLAFEDAAVPSGWALALFVLGGLLAPGVSRAAVIAGIDRLGASVSVPIHASIYPLIAVLVGALVLSEPTGWGKGVGALGIASGVWLLTRDEPQGAPARTPRRRRRSPVRLVYLLPIGGGIAIGVGDGLKKAALNLERAPLSGAAIAVLVALWVWVLFTLASPSQRQKMRGARDVRAFGWYALHGAFSAAAFVGLFLALSRGRVSVVSPIVSTHPIIVLASSVLFLGEVERVRLRTVLGSVITVASVVLIAVTR